MKLNAWQQVETIPQSQVDQARAEEAELNTISTYTLVYEEVGTWERQVEGTRAWYLAMEKAIGVYFKTYGTLTRIYKAA